MSETARARWNARWSEREMRALEGDPAPWLVQSHERAPVTAGARALDVACGDGRNAAYLAGLGFTVDAVDVSDVAVAAVRRAAADRGLAVRACRMDLEQAALPEARYAVVVQFNYLQRDLFAALAASLIPGGVVIAETFARRHADPRRGRIDPRYLLADDELRTAFPGLEVLRYRELITGSPASPRAVAGIVARRPSGATA
ncbi:MAG: methyltransferase domain-containing protein [Solirubrobacteraceae bacterium]